jgi:hypothetical protein
MAVRFFEMGKDPVGKILFSDDDFNNNIVAYRRLYNVYDRNVSRGNGSVSGS